VTELQLVRRVPACPIPVSPVAHGSRARRRASYRRLSTSASWALRHYLLHASMLAVMRQLGSRRRRLRPFPLHRQRSARYRSGTVAVGAIASTSPAAP
jgi:hypothetical protein